MLTILNYCFRYTNSKIHKIEYYTEFSVENKKKTEVGPTCAKHKGRLIKHKKLHYFKQLFRYKLIQLKEFSLEFNRTK